LYAQNVSYFGANASNTLLNNPIIVARAASSTNTAGQYFVQAALENQSNTGSADYIAYVDTYPGPSNDHGWVDMGIAGSAFSDPNFGITKSQDGYIFSGAVAGSGAGGNLVFATDSTGVNADIVFATGGFLSTNEVMRFSNTGKALIIKTSTTSTSNTTGALQVQGGVGVTGNVYATNMYVNNNQVAAIPDVLALAIALG
jgi:hypothetical protein